MSEELCPVHQVPLVQWLDPQGGPTVVVEKVCLACGPVRVLKIPRPVTHTLTALPLTSPTLRFTCSDCPDTTLEVDWMVEFGGRGVDEVCAMAQTSHRRQMGVIP